MKKRSLSLLLALLLILSILPGFAAAAQRPGDRITVDLAPRIIQAGGKPEAIDKLNPEVNEDVYDAIVAGLSNWDKAIDLSEFSISYSDCGNCFAAVLNTHPEFFYVDTSYSFSGESTVFTLNPTYKSEFTKADVSRFQSVCDNIIRNLPDATVEEELLYIHDYIVTHCQYDDTLSGHTAYDCLVRGSAVCEGYELAFTYLCSRAGLEAESVVSNSLSHGWNIVRLSSAYIDEAYYYVDCTWDDPKTDGVHNVPCYCGHAHFLRNKSTFMSTHASSDWKTPAGVSVYSCPTTDAYEYGAGWWKDLIRPVQWVGTTMAYAKPGDHRRIFLRGTGASSEQAVTLLSTDAIWFVWGSNSAYYPDSYITVAALGDCFYCSTPTQIFKVTVSGTVSLFYTLTSAEQAEGYIYGIQEKNGSLVYFLGQSPLEFTEKVLSVSGTPGAISSVTTSAAAGKTTVSWTASSGAKAYIVQRRVKDSSTWTTLNSNVSVLSFVDTTGVGGTVYQYRVRGRDGTNYGPFKVSSVVRAIAGSSSATPGAISSVTVNAVAGKTTVSWAASSGAKTYIVQRRVKDGDTWTTLNSNVSDLSFDDTTGVGGTVYQYRVRGRNGTSYGPFKVSSVVRAIAGSSSATPGAISSVTVSAVTGKVNVSWTASSGAKTYILQRRVKDSDTWTTLGSNINGLSFADTTAVAGTVYQYRVRGRNGTSYGSFKASSVVRAK